MPCCCRRFAVAFLMAHHGAVAFLMAHLGAVPAGSIWQYVLMRHSQGCFGALTGPAAAAAHAAPRPLLPSWRVAPLTWRRPLLTCRRHPPHPLQMLPAGAAPTYAELARVEKFLKGRLAAAAEHFNRDSKKGFQYLQAR